MPQESQRKTEIIDQEKIDFILKNDACGRVWNLLINLKHSGLDGYEFDLVTKTLSKIAKDLPPIPSKGGMTGLEKEFSDRLIGIFQENLERMSGVVKSLKNSFKSGDGFDNDDRIANAIKECLKILGPKEEIDLSIQSPPRNSLSSGPS